LGKLVNPRASNLTPERLAALLACISAEEWEEPDLALALRLEGIAHTRYLRSALALPPVADEPRTGDLVVAEAPDGQVIGRVYSRQTGGGRRYQIWLWRRFPAGTDRDAVALSASELRAVRVAPGVIVRADGETEATAPTRPVRKAPATLPTVADLQRRKEAVINATWRRVAQLDAQIEAAKALEDAEAQRVKAEAAATAARERAMALLTGGAS